MKIDRTIRTYNLHLVDPWETEGIFDIPKISCNVNEIPNNFIPFNFALSYKGDCQKLGVHFYIDDYQFERVWSAPERYIELLKRFGAVITPDYSLCFDMPQALQIWNVYRQRMLGNYWQRNGIKIIPSFNFSDSRSYQYCFDGIRKSSIVSVGNRGIIRNALYTKRWKRSMAEAVRRLTPTKILIYGSKIEFDHGDAEVVWIPARKITKVVNSGKRTKYLIAHPELIRRIAKMEKISNQDLEDFCQDVIVKSMNDADKFDPTKSSIETWSYNFVKICVKKFREKQQRNVEQMSPELEASLVDMTDFSPLYD